MRSEDDQLGIAALFRLFDSDLALTYSGIMIKSIGSTLSIWNTDIG